MTTVQQGFKDAGDRLSALTLKLKMHYEEQREGDTGQGLRDAVDRFGSAIGDVFDAIEKAAKDEGVRADARDAGASLRDAFSTAFNEIGDDLKRIFEKKPAA